MPVVFVHMLKGRSKDQKSRLVHEVTRAMVEIAGADPSNVHVVIEETESDNWGRAGVLLADDRSEESEAGRDER
jgi:4-oxalocrotonate tautomerase